MNKNKWERRLVFIADEIDIESLEHSKEGLELLKNKELTIIPITESEILENDFILLGNPAPQPGMVLLMSPHNDNTYVEINEASTLIAIEKALLTIRLCNLLGAKSAKIENIKIIDKENEKEITFNAEKNLISGDLNSKKSQIENLKNQINTKGILSGGKPNFEKAEELLKKNKLVSDPLYKNLDELVRDSDNSENKLLELTQEFSLTQSLQKTFDLAAKINFPMGYVSGNYKSVAKEKIEIFISFEIKF